jgi:hypothetical protein
VRKQMVSRISNRLATIRAPHGSLHANVICTPWVMEGKTITKISFVHVNVPLFLFSRGIGQAAGTALVKVGAVAWRWRKQQIMITTYKPSIIEGRID